MAAGYLYILTNVSLPYLKIGMTRRSVRLRAEELFNTSVPTPFEIFYQGESGSCEQAEKLVHKRLKNYRVKENREFFEINAEFAQAVIEDVLKEIDELYSEERVVSRVGVEHSSGTSCTALGKNPEMDLVASYKEYKVYQKKSAKSAEDISRITKRKNEELAKLKDLCLKELAARVGPWLRTKKDKQRVKQEVMNTYRREVTEVLSKFNIKESSEAEIYREVNNWLSGVVK